MKVRRLIIILIGMGLSTAACAEEQIFQLCDGYGSPTSTGDGMTKPATGVFGLFLPMGSAGNTVRVTPPLGSNGAVMCTKALADPRLPEKFWMRRVSLLRARAIHNLAAGSDKAHVEQAAADLELASAAVREPEDAFYRRSLGLGLDLVRAYTLRQMGRADESRQIAAEAYAKRPFNRQILIAMEGASGDDHTAGSYMSLDQAFARLDPRHIDSMFRKAFYAGDFKQVIALHPHLVVPIATRGIGFGTARMDKIQRAYDAGTTLKHLADRAGQRAYAELALGNKAGAEKLLADTQTQIEEKTPARFAPLAYGQKEDGNALNARAINSILVVASAEAMQRLQDWKTILALRADIATSSDIGALLERMGGIPRIGAPVELLEAVQTRWPDVLELKAIIADRKFEEQLRQRMDYSSQIQTLFEGLPHAEMAGTIVPYKKANSALIGSIWGGVSGFKIISEPTSQNVTVEFLSEYGSPTATEELALLRAADITRNRGYNAFVILGRRDYQRTQNTTMYGMVLRSDPMGYSTQLDIELLDKNNLPPRFDSLAWRVLDADAVLASLGPAYGMPVAVADP